MAAGLPVIGLAAVLMFLTPTQTAPQEAAPKGDHNLLNSFTLEQLTPRKETGKIGEDLLNALIRSRSV